MPHTEGIAVFALVLGALLGGVYVVRVHGASVNREALTAAFRKLLAAKNGSRAIKLSQAAPASPLCGAMRAALEACRDGKRPTREQTDYRQGALDDSPDAVIAWVRAGYDVGFAEVAKRFESARVFAVVSALLFVVVAAGANVGDAVSPGFAIAAAVALLIVVHAARVDHRIHLDRDALFEAVSGLLYQIARTPESFTEMPPAPAAPHGHGRLVFTVTEPGGTMRTFECTTEIVKIGRDPKSHLRLASDRVSRMHAVIERTADGATIIDLGNADGTVVNGERVNKRTLSEGDVIVLADCELRASFPDLVWRGANASAPG